MMNRYNMEEIIRENPKEAHNIIAGRLNNEYVWALFVTGFVLEIIMFLIVSSFVYRMYKGA